jgi:hypothetical protein
MDYLHYWTIDVVKPKDPQLAVGEENRRAAHRMERFECYGKLHITPHEGIADVTIVHRRWHKSYVSITLPDKWRTFIVDNHRMGPAKVCRRCDGTLIQ